MNKFKINDIVRFKRDGKYGVVKAIKNGYVMLDGSLYDRTWFPESEFKPTEYISDNGDIKVGDLVIIKPPINRMEGPGFVDRMHEYQKLVLRVTRNVSEETVELDDGGGYYWDKRWLHRVLLDIFQYVKTTNHYEKD